MNPPGYEENKKVIRGFRLKLKTRGQSLKWWHNRHVAGLYKYSYFVRQLNTPDSLQRDLYDILYKFVGKD